MSHVRTAAMRLIPVLAIAAAGAAQSRWLPYNVSGGPSVRLDAAVAYDVARSVMVLFGGSPGQGETWEWDGTTWLQRNPPLGPSPRYDAAMAYDIVRQRMVLFGGGPYGLSDSWEWDGTTWSRRGVGKVPPRRHSHAMVYDFVRERMAVFGGSTGIVPYGDTWEWDGRLWHRPPDHVQRRRAANSLWRLDIASTARFVERGPAVPARPARCS